MIRVKRVYDPVSEDDGFRVLVDRLWPRGISKASARIDLWLRDCAPSDALRKWYQHDHDKWDEFRRRYFDELEQHTEVLEPLYNHPEEEVMTFLFSSRELEYNNAYALKEYLER